GNENVSMNLHHLLIRKPGAPVQIVHVLCDEQELVCVLGQFHNRSMRGVWFCIANALATLAIPFPNQFRIALERFRSRQLCRIEIPPVTVLAAKSRDSAFGGNSRAGDYENAHSEMRVVAALMSSADRFCSSLKNIRFKTFY